MNRFLKTLFSFVLLFILHSIWNTAFATSDPPYIKRLDGAKGQIKKDSLMTVADNNFYNTGLSSWITKPYYEKNTVTLKINEDSSFYLPSPFTVAVVIRTTYLKYKSLTDSSVTVRTDTLIINYDSTKTYTAANNLIFDSAQQVQVKILGVSVTNTTKPSQVLKSVILETQIQSYTNYNWSCTANIDSAIVLDNNTTRITSTGEMLASWANVFGADEYDLEWTFIDQQALNDSVYGNPSSPDSAFVAKIFANNATRITTSNLSYGIPLVFPGAGKLYVRVRPVQIKSDGTRITSVWSSKYLSTGLGVYYFSGHETGYNWQSSVSFAEDGKRKVVVQYFDGSLRGRQTVTKDNSTNIIDVAETFYDYQGRPVIQVLPVPTLSNAIKYTKLFNIANSGEYDKHVYDTAYDQSTYCNSAAPAMSTTSGAAYYYSSSNSNQGGADKYIPNANGRPFTETRYTQDNTGRIAKQSGVGEKFKLGSTKETIYYYASPDQDDLDALFGTEVGDRSHYFKNAVQDANGQFSVSYVDMHGRTIATALAGDLIPPGMDSLKSFNKRTNVVETLSDPNSTVVKDLTMESHRSLLVTGSGDYLFDYHLDPQSFTAQACDNSTVCYNCIYDLTITITDDCNNQKLPGKKPYVVTISKASLASVNDTCNKSSITLDTMFTVPLSPGTYEVTKQLTVSKYADDFYRENVYITKNVCTTKDQFIQQARTQLNTECTPTYTACRDSLGTFSQFYTRYVSAAGIDPATTDTTGLSKTVWITYQDAQRACYELGDTLFSEYDNIRRDMLMDVTAPYGQYANPDSTQDIYSVFHLVSGQTYRVYQTPSIQYKNEYGIPDTVVDDNGNRVLPIQLDVQQFARKFKTSWADALLPYHPEYCRLQRLEADTATMRWNKKFEKTETYSDAVTNGFMNPFVSPALDPVPTGILTSVQNKWKWYVTQNSKTLSMEQFAVMSASCSDSVCAAGYFNSPVNISAITGCNGDKDNAWRIYRNLYLAAKKQVMDSLANVSSGQCTTTAQTLITAHHFPHFYNSADAFNQNGFSFFMTPPNKDVLLDSANRRMDSFYTQNCRAYAQLWISQLKTCSAYTQTDIDNIIPQLVAVCADGSDVNHPFGARNSATSSFETVINNYNAAHSIATSEFCNPDLISAPGFYDKQTLAVDKQIYTKPDSCLCSKLNQYYAEYSNFSAYYSSLSDFFLKRYNTVINESDYLSLMAMCSGSNKCNFLLNPATLPPILQCNSAPSCVNCSDVKILYDAFFTTYGFTPTRDETDTAHQRKNKLFTNYMNSRLGFNKQAWEYIDFVDRCEGVVSSKCVSCDNLQSLINGYFSQNGVYGGSESAMLEYIRTQLEAQELVIDTIKIKQALQTCNIGWKQNMCYVPGPKPYVFQGSTDATNINIGDTLADGSPSPFTIETRAYFTNTTNKQALLYYLNKKNDSYILPPSNDNCSDLPAKGYYVYASDSNSSKYLYFYLSDGASTSSYMLVRSAVTIIPFHWYHIAITRTGLAYSDIHIYLDGQLSGTVFVQGAMQLDKGNVTPIKINNGVIYNGDYERKRGLMLLHTSYSGYLGDYASIKDIQLYKRSLSANEITENFYNCASTPSDTTSLMLWAKLNEGSGVPKDYSLYNVGGFLLLYQTYTCNCGNCPGTITSQDSIANWGGKNGLIASPTCKLHYDNVLCNFPDTILLCNNSVPYLSNFNQTSNCSDSAFLAASLGIERYKGYSDSLRNNFDSLYHTKCLQAYKYESFTVTHAATEFHYTLYYYDQAGNLVKTVPPQGVVPNRNSTWLQQVKTARAGGTSVVPTYFFVTEYRYNSLNQVIAQTTPDAGQSKFFYDPLGRLVLSQNSKQSTLNNYSYTKYDYIGRITEVGQMKSTESMDRVISRTQSQLDLWFSHADTSRKEITKTVYDQPYVVSLAPLISQTNLRNRVSWTAFYNKAIEADTLNPVAATYYSYDIHGNVDTLLQDYKSAMDNSNRFKKIIYDYDLVSGKVNKVAYQPGNKDQFYHRYTYDAENRLTDVETSSDQLYWEHDAYYSYYKHGPLSRVLLGKQQVQGIDYAYTLQGWLKGINSTSLMTGDDMGGDGKSTGVASNNVARDVLGLALEYYGYDDYDPIAGSSKKPFADGYATSAFKPLYNGNIAAVSFNIQGAVTGGITTPLFYNYRYDQLNRLTGQQAFTGLNFNTNAWTPSAQNDYKEGTSYDANGNIIGYLRNGTTTGGTALSMDSLVYHYYYIKTNGQIKNYVPSFPPTDAAKLTNKLAYISDTVSANNYTVDIDNQTNVTNYIYDSIGNLTKDVKENIDSIYWNVYGKITQINKHDGTVIKYAYDAAGNRISKIVGTVKTIYVRDASGNVMSVYVSGDTANAGHMTQSEVHLYGSSRLGILRPNIDMTVNLSMPGVGSKYFTTFIRGRKFFEITNHLGNVLVTITDKKTGIRSTSDTSKVNYYLADIASAQDYYPFGMQMPGRVSNTGSYRYGFNGKEIDSATYGQGNEYDYGFRIYNPRIGRFLSVDPLQKDFSDLSAYQFAENDVIRAIDLDGLEKNIAIDGSVIFGPMNMAKVNADILSKYSKPQQQAMKQSAAIAQLQAYTPNSVTPITSPTKRVGVSDHQEDFSSRKASEQKLIFSTSQAQSNKQFSPPQAIIKQYDVKQQYTDFEWGMITAPTTQASAMILCPGCAIGVGGLQTYAGLSTGNYREAGAGVLNMIGGGLGLTGKVVPNLLSATEQNILSDAQTILNSKDFEILQDAYKNGVSAEINVGGRPILYEPGFTYADAMTLHNEGGFLLGPSAFSSQGSLSQTVLWELTRLHTQNIAGLSVEQTAVFSQNAQQTSERLLPLLNKK